MKTNTATIIELLTLVIVIVILGISIFDGWLTYLNYVDSH